MEIIEIGIQTVEVVAPEVEPKKTKEKQIRYKRAPERYLPDGTYNFKPLSPTYQKDYYKRTKVDSPCEYCHVICSHPARLKEHLRKSKTCKRIREAMVPPTDA